MQLPADLRYSSDHEWVRLEDGKLKIGITDYAQDALGDIVFVSMPNLGDTVEPGAAVSEIESTKSVSEIYAPLRGIVLEVNGELTDGPDRINADPYGEGWLFVLEPTNPDDFTTLLDADAYRALVEG